jgi:nonsense-mediated mRNA decay protein 3
MQGENFCPLCGKTKGRFLKGFCEQCFLKKHGLVEIPESVHISQCKSCGKYKLFGKMAFPKEDQLARLVEKKVKAKGLEQEVVFARVKKTEEGFEARVLVKGIVDSTPLSFEKTIPIEVDSFQCDPCMRLSSQYHEAIIQIRGLDKKKMEQALEKVLESLASQRKNNTLSLATETKKAKNGLDLKVGSKKAAQNAVRAVQKSLGGETKTSSKLLGSDKKGKEKHRFTFLLRV